MPGNAGFRPEELNRRAFQKASAQAIDRHATAINALQDQLRVTREFMADLSVRLDGALANIAILEDDGA